MLLMNNIEIKHVTEQLIQIPSEWKHPNARARLSCVIRLCFTCTMELDSFEPGIVGSLVVLVGLLHV